MADKLTKAMRDQQLGLPVDVDRQALKEFLESWLEGTARTTVRPRTLTSCQQIVNLHIVPAWGKRALTKLTPQDVQDLLAGLTEKGLSPRSVQYIRAVLRAALNKALKWGLIGRNPAALVDPPRVHRRPVEPFTVEHMPKLLAAFDKERLGPLYVLCMAHGLRQGEALRLRGEDLDLAGGTLRVAVALQWREKKPELVEPKTAHSRGVSLCRVAS